MKLVKIWHDEFAESPREWDNLGTMVCFHKRYLLGDKHNYKTPYEFWFALLEEIIGNTEKAEELVGNVAEAEGLVDWRAAQSAFAKAGGFDKIVILPLYLYDHCGITMKTTPFSCPWDSGQVGWIYVWEKDICAECGVKHVSPELRERVEAVLRSEVEVYDYYLRGETYGVTVYEVYEGIEVLDSCGGFFGSRPAENGMLEYMPEEVRRVFGKLTFIHNGMIVAENGAVIDVALDAGRELKRFLQEQGLLSDRTLREYNALRALCSVS